MKKIQRLGNSIKVCKKHPNLTQFLIGLLIFLIALLLSSCTQTKIVYKEMPREDIQCQNNITTPLSMAQCLKTYIIKYRGIDGEYVKKNVDKQR